MSLHKHWTWLQEELKTWQEKGLIDPKQVPAINDYYNNQVTPFQWGQLIFSVFGACLIGLGIILFFAYNWQEMHKFTKLSIVLGSLTVAHLIAFTCLQKNTHRALPEGLYILTTMLFGAGIWLIAQIYHIDEHYPNAFLAWGLAALITGLVLRSSAQGFLSLAILATWISLEVFKFDNLMFFTPFLGILLTIHSYRQKNVILLTFTLPVLWLSILASHTIHLDNLFIMSILFGQILIALGYTPQIKHFENSPQTLRVIGFTIQLISVYICSFMDIRLKEIMPIKDTPSLIYTLVSCLIVISLWTFTLLQTRNVLSKTQKFHIYLLIATVVYLFLSGLSRIPIFTPLIFNIILITHSILFITTGCTEQKKGQVIVGCTIFSIVIFGRYFDLFDSLISRAVTFTALGIGIFVIANFYQRKKDPAHA